MPADAVSLTAVFHSTGADRVMADLAKMGAATSAFNREQAREAQRAADVRRRADLDRIRSRQKADAELFKIDNTMRAVARRAASRVALMGVAIMGAIGPAVALTAALWPMIGALGAIPAVTFSAVSGIVALVAGFKNLLGAMQKTSGGGADLEAQERRLERAQREVTRAQKALTDARKDATRNIAAMNRELRRATLDERSALLAIKDAQKALREARSSGDRMERERALIAYEESVISLEEVRARLVEVKEEEAEVRVAGVEGSEAVIAALERQQDALYELRQAQKGMSGGGGGGAAEAYEKLSDAGKKLVDTIKSLGSAWREVGQVTQQALLTGVADDVRRLSERYLPLMREHLPAIAQGWNNAIHSISAVSTTPSFLRDMNDILANTAVMWQRVGLSFGRFHAGFRHWTWVGSQFMPRLGDWMLRMGERFEAWSRHARDSGRAFRWIEEALYVGHQFNELMGAWGTSLGKLFALGAKPGFLEALIEGSRAFRDWLDTAEGQEQVIRMWERLRDVSSQMWRLIKAGLDALSQSDVSALAQVFRTFAMALEMVADQMRWLNPLLRSVIPLFVLFKSVGMGAKIAASLFTITIMAVVNAFRLAILPAGQFGLVVASTGKHAQTAGTKIATLGKLAHGAGLHLVTAGRHAQITSGMIAAAGAKTVGAGIALMGLSTAAITAGASLIQSGGIVEGLALITLGAVGMVSNFKSAVIPGIQALITAFKGLSTTMKALTVAGGLATLATAIMATNVMGEDLSHTLEHITEDLKRMGETGKVTATFRQYFGEGEEAADRFREAILLADKSGMQMAFNVKNWGISFADWQDAGEKVRAVDKAMADLVDQGMDAKDVWNILAGVYGEANLQLMQSTGQMPLYLDALERQKDSTLKLADASSRAAAAKERQKKALDDFNNAIKAQADPIFAVIDANNRLIGAQQRLAEVQANGKASAKEIEDATWDVTRAMFDQKSALDAFLAGGGSADLMLRTLEEWRKSGKITEEQFRLIEDQINGVADAAQKNKDIEMQIRVKLARESLAKLRDQYVKLGNAGLPGAHLLARVIDYVLKMHQGGIVPGPIGTERLILAQAGERVTPWREVQREQRGERAQPVDVHVYLHEDREGFVRVMRHEVRIRGAKSFGLEPAR